MKLYSLKALPRLILRTIGRSYIRRILREEYINQRIQLNERPIEFRFCFDCLTQTGATTVLDIGSGNTALPHLLYNCGCKVTAIDNVSDYWPSGLFNRHWAICDEDIVAPTLKQKFEMVTCISVIEHIEQHVEAFTSMAALTAPGGWMVVTTPYNEIEHVDNVYALPTASIGKHASYICRSSSRQTLNQWINATNLELITQEYWHTWTGRIWAQGKRVLPPKKVRQHNPHQLTCLLFHKPHR